MSDDNSMADEIIDLKKKLEKLEEQNAELTKQNTEVKEQNAKLVEEIGVMKAEKFKQNDQRQPIASNPNSKEMFEKNLTDLVEKINEKGAKMASRKRLPIWLNEVLAWIKRMEMADSKLSTSCWTFQQLCWPKLHLNAKSHIVYFLHFWGAYKWSTNWKECGRDLTILEDGFVAKYTGRNRIHNCVRAISPVPAFNLSDNTMKIAFYFEVELLKIQGYSEVNIGFCTQEFPLEGSNLWRTNAIKISYKGGITTGPATHNTFENIHGSFEEGDVIGTGIIHSPANSSMHCFSTCNGKLLGKAELPKHFMTLQLFPAITTYYEDNTIRANFGKEEWRFKQFDQLIQQQ